MPKNLSAKYYQEDKERLKKTLWMISKSFYRKKRKKATIWSWMLEKSLRRWKKISRFCIEKYMIKWEKKCFIVILKNYFNLEQFASL